MAALDYKGAGVDIDAGNEFIRKISPLARETFRKGVLAGLGGFGAMFSLSEFKFKEPVLVSSTDGVGTKLKIAFRTGLHSTVGIDLVAMCANDVVVQGAEPLFFLDYLATGKLDPAVHVEILRGVAEGCKQAGCALVGGETAELPGMYRAGEYDLAGFCVGIAERCALLDGSGVRPGDALLGLASSGLHSNGYSLVRKIFLERLKWKLDKYVPELGRSLGEELLIPTRIYVKSLLRLMGRIPVKALAHITGGGLLENLPRVLPRGCQAVLRRGTWDVPPVFSLIKEKGKVSEREMLRVFNNGIGMVIVLEQGAVQEAMVLLGECGETPFLIGWIDASEPMGASQLRLE
jgi:phosphoribosylformylglycinamidine cyclo-ligase